MCLFLIVFWCSAVVARCGGLNIFPFHSRFGEFNFPVTLDEFPVRAATVNFLQELDFTHRFCGLDGGCTGKIDEIPGSTGKTGSVDRWGNAQNPASSGFEVSGAALRNAVDLRRFPMHRSDDGNATPGRRSWRHPKSCRISCCRPIAGAR